MVSIGLTHAQLMHIQLPNQHGTLLLNLPDAPASLPLLPIIVVPLRPDISCISIRKYELAMLVRSARYTSTGQSSHDAKINPSVHTP